jgi:L-fuculose-phosphate aldolase
VPKIKREYKAIVAESAKRFYQAQLTPGMDSGDVSIRDEETGYIYIYPRPGENFEITDWTVLKPENICVVDADGNLVEDTGFLPTVEAPMHLAIYKARPEINAIIHGHPIYSSVFAVTGKNIPLALAEQALFLGGEIVCAEYGLVGSQALADNIVTALKGNKMAALLRNHGTVVLGKDLAEAFVLADFVEHGARVAIMGMSIGKIIEVAPDNILDPSLL